MFQIMIFTPLHVILACTYATCVYMDIPTLPAGLLALLWVMALCSFFTNASLWHLVRSVGNGLSAENRKALTVTPRFISSYAFFTVAICASLFYTTDYVLAAIFIAKTCFLCATFDLVGIAK